MWLSMKHYEVCSVQFSILASVVQRVDSIIDRISRYPEDIISRKNSI